MGYPVDWTGASGEEGSGWTQRLKNREADLTGLRARWTTDEDLLYLTAYKMKRLDGQQQPVDKTYNMTMNDPGTFAARVIAVLMGAYQQEVVEGEGLTDEDKTYIEDLLRHVEEESTERLLNRGAWPAYAHAVEQMCIRGRASSRTLVRKVGEKIIIDDTPLDARYVTWQYDVNGLEYQSYEVEKRRSEMESEYPGHEFSQFGDLVSLRDLWTRTHNIIWVNDLEVRAVTHPYGECPCIYTICPAGSMLAGPNALSHHGEGIFWLDRGLYPELNRAATILQTLNVKAFTAGLQYESEMGGEAELPDSDEDPREDYAITAVEKGGGYKGMPVPDIRNATRHLLAMLEARVQRGSLPAIDYGNLTFPLSAVAIARLTEGRDQIFLPRIQGLSMFQQQKARLIIRQLVRIGGTIELGAEGHRREFNTEVLKKSFSIRYRYFSQAPEQKIANYAVSEAAKAAGISDETIFKDILLLMDPHGEMRRRGAQDAERMDPAIALYRRTRHLIDEGKDVEARLLRATLLRMIRERGMGQEEEAPPAEGQPGKGSALVPLFGKGSGARRANRQVGDIADEMATAEKGRTMQADNMRAAREVERRA